MSSDTDSPARSVFARIAAAFMASGCQIVDQSATKGVIETPEAIVYVVEGDEWDGMRALDLFARAGSEEKNFAILGPSLSDALSLRIRGMHLERLLGTFGRRFILADTDRSIERAIRDLSGAVDS